MNGARRKKRNKWSHALLGFRAHRCKIEILFYLMVAKPKTWLVLPLLLLASSCMQHCVHGKPQVPCLFIFGDSLSDAGNNNNLQTLAKTNYKPYGMNFPGGPTGRFTNGRTTIDIIGQLLGFRNFIPPFANTGSSNILEGVNYASGSAGIRIESGTHLGADISLGLQLANHGVTFSKLEKGFGGSDETKEYLKKCLYYVNIGSNDYINNYFHPNLYATSRIYSPQEYAKILINQLSLSLQSMHDLGARKFVLVGLGQIGCSPNAMSRYGTKGSCVEEMNAAASIFNDKLKALVDQYNNNFVDSKFIFINVTAGGNAPTPGLKVFNAPCCPTREDGQCVPNQTPCQNGHEHVFWDQFHTTEAANLNVAMTSYNSSNSPAFTYPMDINHLVNSS
ncbi:hypothetical protein VNO77_44374 [Canavalia gladiata]|uniref:Uncharacterized protein n=1 Tax=Canavalia gladiata TaxID=3824 RepID=A0AAN9JY35_CANGL